MEEDEDLALQLELGKKKKKKKKPVLDVTTGDATEQQAPPPPAPSSVSDATPPTNAEPIQQEDELILPAKKKKKAAVAKSEVAVEPAKEAPHPAATALGNVNWAEFDFPKKKKRKRPNVTFEGFDVVVLGIDVEDKDDLDATEEAEPVDNSPWAGSDRDYTYEELLERVFNIMRQKNPKMVGGQKKKLVMKPPQVVRVGAKKTSFVNFTEICKQVHRQPKHLLAFLLAELGTSGSVDGNHQLVIKGRFQQKQIETVLRRYISRGTFQHFEITFCGSCPPFFCRGVRYLPHVSFARDDVAEGDAAVFPAV
jgi:translation initiation factor 2 subunit 2